MEPRRTRENCTNSERAAALKRAPGASSAGLFRRNSCIPREIYFSTVLARKNLEFTPGAPTPCKQRRAAACFRFSEAVCHKTSLYRSGDCVMRSDSTAKTVYRRWRLRVAIKRKSN
jgi:hypothetical protein